MNIHLDSEIGLTMGDTKLRQVDNHGLPCWIATAPIGSIFGAEVHGELRGIGNTKEQALERLQEERRKLAESLWE